METSNILRRRELALKRAHRRLMVWRDVAREGGNNKIAMQIEEEAVEVYVAITFLRDRIDAWNKHKAQGKPKPETQKKWKVSLNE